MLLYGLLNGGEGDWVYGWCAYRCCHCLKLPSTSAVGTSYPRGWGFLLQKREEKLPQQPPHVLSKQWPSFIVWLWWGAAWENGTSSHYVLYTGREPIIRITNRPLVFGNPNGFHSRYHPPPYPHMSITRRNFFTVTRVPCGAFNHRLICETEIRFGAIAIKPKQFA